jgi:hypothetical protein
VCRIWEHDERDIFGLIDGDVLSNYQIPHPKDPGWQTFFRLFRLPWFYRAWIVQEAAVDWNDADTHHNLICGDSTMDWANFQIIMKCVEEIGVSRIAWMDLSLALKYQLSFSLIETALETTRREEIHTEDLSRGPSLLQLLWKHR